MTTAAPSATWHYPPELLELVVDAVARLNRGKDQEIDFFRGAGVPDQYLRDVAHRIATDREKINKFEIARTVLVRLNEAGDKMLGQRREILKRIVETESFEHCWPNDRLAAKGVVAEIQKVVGTKDSFTRMKTERDRERETHLAAKRKEQEERERQRAERAMVKADLFALFGEKDPWKRGKQLESVLNRLFALDGLSIREAFHLNGDESEGVVEQIDGVIDLDGQLYLVEMKWLVEKVGPEPIGYHHSRVFLRHAANGMFISASGFTEPAIAHAKLALSRMVSVLCELEEIVSFSSAMPTFRYPRGRDGDHRVSPAAPIGLA